MKDTTPASPWRNHRVVLTSGSMFERLRRDPSVTWDPDIAHAALLYDSAFRQRLANTQREYLEVAENARLPMVVSTATWRATHERVSRSRFGGTRVNRDHVMFAREMANEASVPTFVAGQMGPAGDGYDADIALPYNEAIQYHSGQAEELAEAGADFLTAMTLPALSEARGMAAAIFATGTPFFVSFVVQREGTLLDGTPLREAIARIDDATPPEGYWVNCVHPEVLEQAVGDQTLDRLVGFRSNSSSLRPKDLDNSQHLVGTPPALLGPAIARVRQKLELRFLGGCCGTSTPHLEALATALSQSESLP